MSLDDFILTAEILGPIVLFVFWVNILLMAGSLLHRFKDAWRERRMMDGEFSLLRVKVLEDGPLAVFRLAQLGRRTDSGSILFHDLDRRDTIYGAEVRVGNETLEVLATDGEAWLDATRRNEVTGLPSDAEEMREALRDSERVRGYRRLAEIPLGQKGEEVWIWGRRTGDVFQARGVSDSDPRGACRRRMVFCLLGAAGTILGAIATTAVAAIPPWYQGWSTVGGALCLAYWVMIQEWVVNLDEAQKLPGEAHFDQEWSLEGATAADATPIPSANA